MKAFNCAALTLLVSIGTATFAAAAERPATKAEISNIAVGRTVNGTMKYMPDGRYTYGGRDPGKYTISAGKVCVNFDSGFKRCDRIVTADGKSFALINAEGKRFPYK
jgi:hypothetical protein